MKTISRVGIALAAYQPETNAFANQLESIQNQDHLNWICLVQFDSDSSKFLEKIQFARFIQDSRFIFKQNPDRLGHKLNFQAAIQALASRGDVDAIATSDQDDFWLPRKLSESIKALQAKPSGSLVHSDLRAIYKNGESIESVWRSEFRRVDKCSPLHFLVQNSVTGCSMMFDSELARRFPVIPSSFRFHDHWYALVAAFHGGVYPIPEALIEYHQHSDNVVGVVKFNRFAIPFKRRGLILEFRECVALWRQSKEWATGALVAGLPINEKHLKLFIKRWDAGFGFIILALSEGCADPKLRRQCARMAIGKILARN